MNKIIDKNIVHSAIRRCLHNQFGVLVDVDRIGYSIDGVQSNSDREVVGKAVPPSDVLLAEISGYVAMDDSKSKDISNMSFDGSLSRIHRHWGNSQQIKRCKILISNGEIDEYYY